MPSSIDIVRDTLAHRQPSRLAVDFGATSTSGVHCSVVAELRDYYGLEKRPVTIHEIGQMLGRIDPDLREAMGVDVAAPRMVVNRFGVKADGEQKEWRTPWGQTVLIPAGMALGPAPDGGVYAYPQGDAGVPPSSIMPASSYFFDATDRQEEFDEDDPNLDDNLEEFGPLPDGVVAAMAREAAAARADGRAVAFNLPGTPLGDIGQVPAVALKHPKGIRGVAEWYMSIAVRPEFLHRLFARQTDIALENLARISKAVGDLYDVVGVCGTDFGTQTGTFCSRATFDELYLPYYKKVNGWIHANTGWKTYKHSCGAVIDFIDGFVEAGFDILNPVQCSAAGMDPERIKKTYGDRIVFWGAGVNTQKTLPFGTPEEVRREVLERCRIFSPGGGFVFSSIHNVQALTPLPNVVAMLDAIREFNAAGK